MGDRSIGDSSSLPFITVLVGRILDLYCFRRSTFALLDASLRSFVSSWGEMGKENDNHRSQFSSNKDLRDHDEFVKMICWPTLSAQKVNPPFSLRGEPFEI
jgi:hypothetical protein